MLIEMTRASITDTRSWNNYLSSNLSNRYRTREPRVSSELRQTREVRVWRRKREVHKACVSEALLPKRDVQQREVRASPHRYETRVSTTKRRIQKVRVSQVSLAKCDNQ